MPVMSHFPFTLIDLLQLSKFCVLEDRKQVDILFFPPLSLTILSLVVLTCLYIFENIL